MAISPPSVIWRRGQAWSVSLGANASSHRQNVGVPEANWTPSRCMAAAISLGIEGNRNHEGRIREEGLQEGLEARVEIQRIGAEPPHSGELIVPPNECRERLPGVVGGFWYSARARGEDRGEALAAGGGEGLLRRRSGNVLGRHVGVCLIKPGVPLESSANRRVSSSDRLPARKTWASSRSSAITAAMKANGSATHRPTLFPGETLPAADQDVALSRQVPVALPAIASYDCELIPEPVEPFLQML